MWHPPEEDIDVVSVENGASGSSSGKQDNFFMKYSMSVSFAK